MSTVLFSRPCYDDVTGYLHFYSKELVSEAEKKGYKVINKEGKETNRSIITSIISKHDPKFLMFNGHGSSESITGHNYDILIDMDNRKLLSGKITYSVSCSSAETLGRAVGSEDTTFIGYTEDFAIGMDLNSQAAIHRDKWAKLFLEPSNILVKSLLKGNTAKEAVEKTKHELRKNISRLKTETAPEAKEFIPYLYNNYLAIEIMGNETKKLL